MKSGHRYIIFIALVIIIIAGILLLVWRDDMFTSLYEKSGLQQTELIGQSLMVAPNTKETLDITILENAKFLVLKKNFNQFNFDLICQDASNSGKQVSVSPGVVSVSAQTGLCTVGTGSPFPLATALNQR
jgi:hypothetical protein